MGDARQGGRRRCDRAEADPPPAVAAKAPPAAAVSRSREHLALDFRRDRWNSAARCRHPHRSASGDPRPGNAQTELAAPQESWAEVLAGFMEERNIRWAEFVGVLVGGLLIVGSSLALVVSFWDTLRKRYLKFLIFVGYSRWSSAWGCLPAIAGSWLPPAAACWRSPRCWCR